MLSIPLSETVQNFIIFRKVVGNVLENLLEMGSASDFLNFSFQSKILTLHKKAKLVLLKESVYINGKVFFHNFTNKKVFAVVKTFKILERCHSSNSVYRKFGLKQLLLNGLISTASLSKKQLVKCFPGNL